MLNLFRWHVKKCPHDSRENLKCQCPIWIDWTLPDGKRVRKSLKLRDWQAAQRRARDMEIEGIVDVTTAVTIQKATDDFEKDAENNVKPITLRKYRTLFKRLNEYSQKKGLIFLKQLNVVEVRDFRNSWTVSPRTAGKDIERLKRFFNWCAENRWLDQSPAKPLKVPKTGDTDVVPFDEAQVEKILKACNAHEGKNKQRLIALTKLMLATGLRIGDATTISKSKIVKQDGDWIVQLRTMKTGTPVSCPIPADLAKALHGFNGEHPFWNGESDAESVPKYWRKLYAEVFKEAEIHGHPHQFRHTLAKRLLVKGTPIGVVAAILGNTEQVCRRNYAKWLPERQKALNQAVKATW
jgi:integrase/recombinase XerD